MDDCSLYPYGHHGKIDRGVLGGLGAIGLGIVLEGGLPKDKFSSFWQAFFSKDLELWTWDSLIEALVAINIDETSEAYHVLPAKLTALQESHSDPVVIIKVTTMTVTAPH